MADNKKPISDNPSAADIKATLPLLRMFSSAIGLARQLGLAENLGEIADGASSILAESGILDLPDRFNSTFAARGWVATESLGVTAAEDAIALATAGKWDEAESVLADSLTEQVLRILVLMPIRHMSKKPPEPSIEELGTFTTRDDIVEEALSLWLEKRYIAALPLILIAADGFASEELGYSPFKDGADLSAFDSIAGHASGLPTLIRAICKSRQTTSWSAILMPYRHGVLHGRDLGFGTRKTVAQAWLLLLALIDWAKAKRSEDSRIAKHEARSAQTWREIAESIQTNKRRARALEQWRPITFSLEEPEPDSPVPTVLAFLSAWKAGRYGPLGAVLVGRFGKTDGKRAFEAKQTFDGLSLLDYRLVSVRQDTPARANAVVWLSAEASGKSVTREFEFGLLRDRPNGDIAFPDDEDGEWGVMAKVAWDVRHAIKDAGSS